MCFLKMRMELNDSINLHDFFSLPHVIQVFQNSGIPGSNKKNEGVN